VFTKELSRKVIFYLVFSVFIVWLVVEPNISLSYRDGGTIILFVFLIQSSIDKRYLLEKLSEKFVMQKKLLNNMFFHSSDLVYMKDEDLNYIDCNPFMKELLDLPVSAEVMGKSDFDFLPYNVAQSIMNYEKKAIQNKEVVSCKFERNMPNGEIKIYDTLIAPTVKDDKITGVLGIMRDITQTENLKEQIIIQNAQLQSILDNVPFMVYLKDLDGKVVVANKKLTDFVHLSLDDIVGSNPTTSYSKDFAERIRKEDLEIIRTKSPIINEYKSDRFSDNKKWFSLLSWLI